MPSVNPDAQLLLAAHGVPIGRPTYLANPYTHADPEVMQARLKAVTLVLDQHTKDGIPALAPVTYTSQMMKHNVSPPQGWYHYDLSFLAGCQSLTLLKLPGYEQSYGVQLELTVANLLGLPIIEIEWAQVKSKFDQHTIELIESGATPIEPAGQAA